MEVSVRKIFNRFFYRPYLRRKLCYAGSNFRLGYSGIINCPESFSIGENFFTGPFAYFSSNKDTAISIGSDVMFGPSCKVIGGNHNITWVGGSMSNAPYIGGGKGIIIEDDVWLGANSIVLDGSVISEGAVIAAGAVVSGFIKPYSICGGVPARFIKYRFSKSEIRGIKSKKYSVDELRSYCKE